MTASAISLPIANAASRDLPFKRTNIESVSPYSTRAFHLYESTVGGRHADYHAFTAKHRKLVIFSQGNGNTANQATEAAQAHALFILDLRVRFFEVSLLLGLLYELHCANQSGACRFNNRVSDVCARHSAADVCVSVAVASRTVNVKH